MRNRNSGLQIPLEASEQWFSRLTQLLSDRGIIPVKGLIYSYGKYCDSLGKICLAKDSFELAFPDICRLRVCSIRLFADIYRLRHLYHLIRLFIWVLSGESQLGVVSIETWWKMFILLRNINVLASYFPLSAGWYSSLGKSQLGSGNRFDWNTVEDSYLSWKYSGLIFILSSGKPQLGSRNRFDWDTVHDVYLSWKHSGLVLLFILSHLQENRSWVLGIVSIETRCMMFIFLGNILAWYS